MPDANGTVTLQDLLNQAGLNKLSPALAAVKLGDSLAGPFVETLTVDATTHTVVLARPAACIENVYGDTAHTSLFVIPTGKTPVDDVSCAISADRKTLTFTAMDGDSIIVTYFAAAVDVTVAAGF